MLHLGLSLPPSECVDVAAGALERIIAFVQAEGEPMTPASGVPVVHVIGADFERAGAVDRFPGEARVEPPVGLVVDLAELSDVGAVNEQAVRGVVARAAALGPWAFIALAGRSGATDRVVPRAMWVAARAAAHASVGRVIAVESWPAAGCRGTTFAYTERHAWRRFSTPGTTAVARRELAVRIVEYGGYEGEAFSAGDRWLGAAAEGEVDVMDSRAWRRAELSHHAAVASRDIDALEPIVSTGASRGGRGGASRGG